MPRTEEQARADRERASVGRKQMTKIIKEAGPEQLRAVIESVVPPEQLDEFGIPLSGQAQQALEGEVIRAPRQYGEAIKALDAVGIDVVCERIENGESELLIARSLRVSRASLGRWLSDDPERASRARDSRARSARAWMDRGLHVLEDAETMFELAKAREIATHCRKYAAILAPREFSEKLALDVTDTAREASAQEVNAKLEALLSVAQEKLSHIKIP